MTYSSKYSSIPVSRILATGLLCASLNGCTVGPNYHVPATPAPPAYKESAPASAIAVPAGEAWWKVFNDATLDDLEKQANDANPDIQIAVAHVDQADAVLRSVHSAQLPTVTAGSVASRNREAQQRPTMATLMAKLPPTTISRFFSVSATRSMPGDGFAVWCNRLQPPTSYRTGPTLRSALGGCDSSY